MKNILDPKTYVLGFHVGIENFAYFHINFKKKQNFGRMTRQTMNIIYSLMFFRFSALKLFHEDGTFIDFSLRDFNIDRKTRLLGAGTKDVGISFSGDFGGKSYVRRLYLISQKFLILVSVETWIF